MASGRSNLPIFIKVIMDSTSDTTLIPPEFIRRFGHNLHDRVFLKLPNGKKLTEVELNRANGQTLMHRGWREFKQRLSLGFGHFLLFEYNGNSQFNVRICDTSAVEINYPSESDGESYGLLEDLLTVRKRKVNVEDQGNNVIVIPNDKRPVKKSHCRVKGDNCQVNKSLGTTPNISSDYNKVPRTESSYPDTHSQRPVDFRMKRDESTDHYGDCSVTATGRRFSRRAHMKETSTVYQRAVAFGSRLNPHKTPFVIRLMQNSHVSYGFSLKLPFSFAGQSLLRAGANSVTLVTNRKKWSVRCLVSGRMVNISGGWRGFANDNGLKVGDVCIFQVANKSKQQQQPPVWNVIIFQT